MIRRLIAILKERRRAKSVDYYFIDTKHIIIGIMYKILKKRKMIGKCDAFLFTNTYNGSPLTTFRIIKL